MNNDDNYEYKYFNLRTSLHTLFFKNKIIFLNIYKEIVKYIIMYENTLLILHFIKNKTHQIMCIQKLIGYTISHIMLLLLVFFLSHAHHTITYHHLPPPSLYYHSSTYEFYQISQYYNHRARRLESGH